MCPPLSCCHRRSTRPGLVRQQLYNLVRLLLASNSAEVPIAQQAALEKQLDTLWSCLHHAMQQYYRVSQSRAQDLTDQVVHVLLREECCRQSVRETISLAEALGLAEAPPATPGHRHQPHLTTANLYDCARIAPVATNC
jgi:hypothetical protein